MAFSLFVLGSWQLSQATSHPGRLWCDLLVLMADRNEKSTYSAVDPQGMAGFDTAMELILRINKIQQSNMLTNWGDRQDSNEFNWIIYKYSQTQLVLRIKMKEYFKKLDLQRGLGEMVLSVKYVSYWHEDLSSDIQHPHKSWAWWWSTSGTLAQGSRGGTQRQVGSSV